FFCRMCVVTFKCRKQYKNHLKGSEHLMNVKAAEEGHPVIPSAVFCDLCKIVFPDPLAYRKHMNKNRHMNLVSYFEENGLSIPQLAPVPDNAVIGMHNKSEGRLNNVLNTDNVRDQLQPSSSTDSSDCFTNMDFFSSQMEEMKLRPVKSLCS